MVEIRLKVEGASEAAARLGRTREVMDILNAYVRRVSFHAERSAAERAPVDTGRLRGSIRTAFAPLRAVVGPTVHYASHVEYGTRPHWPPPGALQPWARRHGFGAGARGDYLARRAIAIHGTKPQPFMRPAAQSAEEFAARETAAVASEIEKVLGTR